MSTGISGIGTLFQRWNSDSSTGAFETVGGVANIDGPGGTRETIDTTTLDDTDGYRTFIGGLRDGGEVSFSMNFTLAGYVLMRTDFEDEDAREYQIVLPDTGNTTLSFMGLVTQIPLTIPMDDKITCDVTIKVSGKVDITS